METEPLTESFITDHDVYLFKEGNHFRLYDKLGAHLAVVDGKTGVHFAVWAPNAKSVSVVGNFNQWQRHTHPLKRRLDSSGIWEGFIPGLARGEVYKYFIVSNARNYQVEKSDPFAFYNEVAPHFGSIVWDHDYEWKDTQWMKERHRQNSLEAPMSIYELHMASWKRVVEENLRPLTYREMAAQLPDYLEYMGYTHVEFCPVMEHPFDGSWGYQTLGYFSPTSRFGTPQDFMYLVDCLHQRGIGVILDWVPSHFPTDEHGLVYFDGTHLYEHADTRKGYHPDWKSAIFNYGRNEVREFLISSAMIWMDKYHADGLRVDGVASMLYLDYSRGNAWVPNEYGGRENLEAIFFLRRLNEMIYGNFPDTQMIAEESTAWGGVSRPTFVGGLGFGMKWNMGWMHDTLVYMCKDPIYRKYHHNDLTFSFLYAFSENFLLSLSHDEVTHGKGALAGKMPGDQWQKLANLRLLFGYMFAHPGKKLHFMGSEFAQWAEWRYEHSIEWHLLQYAPHQGIQQWVKDLNRFYRQEPALYERDFSPEGFEYVDFSDYNNSIISFIRKSADGKSRILAVCNFTPQTLKNYSIGVPQAGHWLEVLNSDAKPYGGSGQGNGGGVDAQKKPMHGKPFSLPLTIPPLGVLFLKGPAVPDPDPAQALQLLQEPVKEDPDAGHGV
ncbi:MAG: 1,4-alpha-glucan branching protein GlgB [Candidatus Omnitrophica bacterium]|nr:1,4-alpha-glucan branching protein GlgB [Candidatus Omnitrophota bacterium]MDE2008615.1 1,4-alpha-glucan branching protein GlgB [Candidatus Omnitrophota bacterium]MDE2214081.1 1,4-alpha-glucan branching protein GlgB [Candidatus Omnitrophota bacterium]MDE2230941.1 1,4-alpha-glucan branching protein GlgB [Candidatus Omnitrophota bacterium]